MQDKKINEPESEFLAKVVQAYLDSYNFYTNVLQFNDKQDDTIWNSISGKTDFTKRFEWVEDDIQNRRENGTWPYRTIDHEKHFLGVPQGGALSGLIANIILNQADSKLKTYVDEKSLIYLRFCDDMIIIGEDKKQVENAFEAYKSTIESLHLYQHAPIENDGNYPAKHWESKTKKPYAWDDMTQGGIPWISFVGIDVRWTGETRIRKKTIHKHMEKQEKAMWEVLREIKQKGPRYSKTKTKGILRGHLDAMSVGRIKYWNYKDNPNTGSWCSAFKIIDDNKWSRHQLRNLDRHKQVVIRKFRLKVRKLHFPESTPQENESTSARFITDMKGMPCSYFGQVLKPWNT